MSHNLYQVLADSVAATCSAERRSTAPSPTQCCMLVQALFVGGNFLTMHNEDAISVCPFYMSRADIKPSKWIPPW